MDANQIISSIISGAVGAGLSAGIIYRFGESILFKHLDHKYSERLAIKNNELQKQLEEKKNNLSHSLQQSLVDYKANIDVLIGERAKFLERKINYILEINKAHVEAARQLRIFSDWALGGLKENYELLSSMSEREARKATAPIEFKFRMNLLGEKLGNVETKLISYHDQIVFNLPILPVEYTRKEIALLNEMSSNLEITNSAYGRMAGILGELAEPEEGFTYIELLNELKENLDNTEKSNKFFVKIDNGILEKSIEGQKLIEALLQEEKN
ncbi:TPA: hypothetical protein NJJ53_004101 [Pseudomonas aeruginosa]|uniref:hypothetical protein n=1 Tax=Pseudomonas aeruginosa TaxID=287 RepID=UPI0003B9B6AE|nr:hypothetical protein [Pseudomonas aeruginosa]EIU2597772.1 hypothetical protein [Pseudomonas aeruginosa]EIU2879072.1 hypothetical protein [Pseudomonas aeruginosa]EIU3498444.1 hypothetical protein [Pseudomonas aeruginosa]ELK4864552.1 hypothetical protein [Pseudomonas aeruginosa]ELM3769346.1 hypothetical protein [Pseudomonas aeruginosa]